MCLFTNDLFSQEITYVEAKQIAIDFFNSPNKEQKSSSTVKVDSFATYFINSHELKNQSPAFYIFNRADSAGFVIISGDKRVKSIIAYSNSSIFSRPNP
jgi:hypothetical protein